MRLFLSSHQKYRLISKPKIIFLNIYGNQQPTIVIQPFARAVFGLFKMCWSAVLQASDGCERMINFCMMYSRQMPINKFTSSQPAKNAEHSPLTIDHSPLTTAISS